MKKIIATFLSIILISGLIFAQEDSVITDTVKLYLKDNVVSIVINKKTKINKEIDELKGGLEDFNQRIEIQMRILSNLQDSLDMLSDKYKENPDTSIQSQIDRLQEKIERSNMIISALEEGIDDINESLEQLEDELEELDEIAENSEIKIKKKFSGHQPLIEFAVCSFNYDFSNPTPENFLTQDYEKSIYFGLNLLKKTIRFWNHGGMNIGLGLGWRSYELKNNVILSTDNNEIIVENAPVTYQKNKIKTFSINLPIFFEIQMGKKNSPFVKIGIIPEYAANRYYKVKYFESDRKVKHIIGLKDVISPILTQASFRLGINGIEVFANYDLIPFFNGNISKYNPVMIGIGILM